MSNHSAYVGANVNPLTNTFRQWMDKTNQVIVDMSTGVVMVTANTTGETTSGNGYVSGIFGANTLFAATALRGGTVAVANTLNISSNVVVANTMSVTGGITANVTGTSSNATNLNNQPGSFYTNATNIASGTVPTARLPVGNTTAAGIVQLVDSVSNTSTTIAATANAVAAAVAIAANATNLSTGTVPNARLNAANTTAAGIVQLVDSTSNTSTTIAATANAVASLAGLTTSAAATAYSNAIAFSANASNLGSGTVATARLPVGNTSQFGVVQLVDSYQNTSTAYPPTAKALNDFFNLYSNTAIPPSNLPAANTSSAGIVQLNDSTFNTSILQAATANAVNGVRTLAANATNLTSGTVPNARLNSGNTTAAGIVQIIDSTSNTSTTIVAVANSVATAYTAAIAANTNAQTALTAAGSAYTNAIATSANATTLSSGTVNNARLNAANTTQAGIVQLVDSTSNTSITIAATANAVAAAFAAASAASTKADTAYSNATSFASSAAATAYSNAVALISSGDATSYSNAVAFAANATNISSGTIAAARLPSGNTTVQGAVIIIDSVANTSTTIAVAANSVLTAYTAAITANTNAATASAQAANASFLSSGTVSAARLPSGNTSASGIIQLTDSIASTSTTTAATPNSAKTAYDQAVAQGSAAYSNATSFASNAGNLSTGTIPTARLPTWLQNAVASTGITGAFTVSTSAPSGGNNGDVWFQREV